MPEPDGRPAPPHDAAAVRRKQGRGAAPASTTPSCSRRHRSARDHRLYAFCREVDDVVDEVRTGSPPRTSWPGGGARSTPLPAAPTHLVMRALQPIAADFDIRAEHLRP